MTYVPRLLVLLFLIPACVNAAEDVDVLRQQLDEQRTLIEEQNRIMRALQQTVESLNQRVMELEGATAIVETEVIAAASPSDTARDKDPVITGSRLEEVLVRDAEGDLNRASAAVQAGDFEGTFKIPGRDNISLSIGGFAKTVVYANANAEKQGAIFLPGLLGLERDDPGGDFNVDATMSRAYLSAAAPVETGRVRAYLEYDLNKGNSNSPDFNVRHAYASYSGKYGDFLAGQHWSTVMDLKVLPEALTDPTMSGAMFARQAQVRYSLPFGSGFTFHTAIEDPDSNDVFSDEPTDNLTSQPDFVLGLEYDDPGRWHVRLNSILRDIEVELPTGERASDDGWGAALTGAIQLSADDKLAMGGAYGEGFGRYLLGLQPGSAGVVDSNDRDLLARDNWGGFLVYSHRWQPGLRSAAIGGYAEAEAEDFQPETTFNNTVYAGANLLWSPLSYLTLGVEYVYGKSENQDGSDQDDHRILFGAQFF